MTNASLLEHGVDVDVNILGGMYPNALQAAIAEGDIHIVYPLSRHRVILDSEDDEFSRALIAAAGDPDGRRVEAILEVREYRVKSLPEYFDG